MNLRFRVLPALFALMALVLFQVEGLWASSACSAAMEMPTTAQTADVDAEPAACPMGASGHPHERDGKGSDGPACPLMPGGAASCVAGAVMLPAADAPSLGAAEDEFSAASSDHAKDLLLAVSLLRPPRA